MRWSNIVSSLRLHLDAGDRSLNLVQKTYGRGQLAGKEGREPILRSGMRKIEMTMQATVSTALPIRNDMAEQKPSLKRWPACTRMGDMDMLHTDMRRLEQNHSSKSHARAEDETKAELMPSYELTWVGRSPPTPLRD